MSDNSKNVAKELKEIRDGLRERQPQEKVDEIFIEIYKFVGNREGYKNIPMLLAGPKKVERTVIAKNVARALDIPVLDFSLADLFYSYETDEIIVDRFFQRFFGYIAYRIIKEMQFREVVGKKTVLILRDVDIEESIGMVFKKDCDCFLEEYLMRIAKSDMLVAPNFETETLPNLVAPLHNVKIVFDFNYVAKNDEAVNPALYQVMQKLFKVFQLGFCNCCKIEVLTK